MAGIVQDITKHKRVEEALRKSEKYLKEAQRVGRLGSWDRDARMLNIVLENLLGNAWKFTNKHPNAKIEVGKEIIEGKTTYFVRDDGAGFDMAYSDRLFTAFQRLHTEAEFPGIGIGLATIRRIIHRHGGKVWAKGAVEKGATFYFTL